MQDQTLRGTLAPGLLQEDAQGVAQPGVVSSLSASGPRVSATQARSSSSEPDIRASGATSAKAVTGLAAGPAARATAWALTAC